MRLPQLLSPIRLLPSQLADQIAAGEVIERPASVLKELIENALDAGAGRIDIELGHGGMDYLRVSDDGHGIPGNELPLALSRHATSKIFRLDDLQSLQSLGFRGEALASICSVSQWEINTQRFGEESAHAMRHDAGAAVIPVNHPPGTTVVIRKLFYNTPARRKFLRAERTEFRHCDEVFRRMALARFDVAFFLKHNERQIQRLPAVTDDIGRSRRVSQLCSEAFVRQGLAIDFPHSGMRLWGWISRPDYSRQQSDIQYFYINGRIIRDRVITHALRLAYQDHLPPGRHAAYVLQLELDPAAVDVNVHPTKHEVRFRETRQVHDFIMRCLRESLRPGRSLTPASMENRLAEDVPAYPASPGHETPGRGEAGERMLQDAFFGEFRAVLLQQFILSQSESRLYLIDVAQAQAGMCRRQWQQAYASGEIRQRPLLIPQELALDNQHRHSFETQQDGLSALGFDLSQTGPARLLLRAIPACLQGYDGQALLTALLEGELCGDDRFDVIERVLRSQVFNITSLDLKQFLVRMAQQRDLLQGCWREIARSDLLGWLNAQQSQHG